MRITRHGKKRLKERVGLSKSAEASMPAKALSVGMCHSDATGRLKKYFDFLFFHNYSATNVRIFGEHVYVFNGDDTLITVLPLPNEHKKSVKKFFDKLKA